MGAKRKCCFGDGTRAYHGHRGCGPDCVHHTSNAFLSSTNVNLLAEFVEFCKSKKEEQHKKFAQGINANCNDQEKDQGESSEFREKLIMYFGQYLPADVIDELCKLLHENSYDKCRFCLMPTESLILSVLQILLDAGQRVNVVRVDSVAPPSIPNIRVNENDTSVASIGKDIPHSLENKKYPKVCSQHLSKRSDEENLQTNHIKPTIHQNSNASREVADFLDGKLMKNSVFVLDTPIVMHQRNCHFDEFASVQDHVPIMNKKAKTEAPTKPGHNKGSKSFQDIGVFKGLSLHSKELHDVEIVGATRFKDRCNQLGKLVDQLHNQKTTMPMQPVIDLTGDNQSKTRIAVNPHQKQSTSGHQFSISDEERGYYNILCGLAHSQWSCFKAVEFNKTSVTYSSLGESVEPSGRVDNFFVAVMCRKFFEDKHPRLSKKHFFYPKVGGCLYTYNCSYDINTVQNSFLGANSAYKLHLSDKLCFPIVLKKHWFVFIVDLRNKLFVFLDSYFDGDDYFQIEARTKLINAFKECWYQHAEVKLDVDSFSVNYPPVPKQHNVVDCGIFAVKFMELWEHNLDLRHIFDQSDIPNMRVKLGVDLFFSKGNSIDKSLVMNLYKQGIDPRICS